MKNLFIPGMNTTKEEYLQIKQLFQNEDFKVEELLENHLLFSKMNKESIVDIVIEKIDKAVQYQDATLICHSMGCNLGVIGARYPTVKKLVLVSPEFYTSTIRERKAISQIRFTKYAYEKDLSLPSKNFLDQLHLVHLFLRSRKWALHELQSLSKPVMIVYSEGDLFVSRIGIEKMIANIDGDVETVMTETSYHNPFMSREGMTLVKRIGHFIR